MSSKRTSSPVPVRLIRVIDGDTVVVRQKGGVIRSHPDERIRLWGMDAPESDQKGGKESTQYLRQLIGGRSDIWLTRTQKDQYGRTVGIIHRDRGKTHQAYNLQMVEGGHAHCYMLSGPESALYRRAEAEAKKKRRGLWKDSRPEVPRDYRRRQEKRQKTLRKVKTFMLLAALALAAGAVLWQLDRLQG